LGQFLGGGVMIGGTVGIVSPDREESLARRRKGVVMFLKID